MRLLHLVGAAKPGGAETFAVRLMGAFQQAPELTQFVLCRPGWLQGRCAALGLPYATAPFGGWWDTHTPWFTQRQVARMTEQFQPTHILAWMNRGVSFMPQGNFVKMARLGGFYNLKYYRGRVTDLIGNTAEIVAYCQAQGWPATHTHLLHNFTPAPALGWQTARAAQRAAWGWKSTDVGLLAAGRLHQVKGLDVALQALALLPANFKLALVGQGPEEGALRALAQQLGLAQRLTCAGWLDDLSPAAAAADIWLAPSRHEPLGNTALDAWVHERPLIVSAVGGLDQLVDDRQQGLKVPPNSPQALAQAIRTMAADKVLQKKVIQGGLTRWQSTYAEPQVVAAYLKLFQQLSGPQR